jgi:AraC-type transcriptional regulator N-terminus
VIGLLAMAIGALVRATTAGISAVMALLFVLTPGPADALVRLLRLLDRPADRAVLAPLIEKEILWRLLTGEQDRIIRQTGSPTAPCPRSATRSAGFATTTSSRCGSRTSPRCAR